MPKKKKLTKPERREAKAAQALHGCSLDSDDTFFYIAGYTSGGAPYGVTWAEMGLAPWQDPDDTI